jgi:superfamily I DNA and/or RNA helicase
LRWDGSLDSLFVKNLENVQGDERDVIFISAVYSKDEVGNFFQRFGPINGAYGHRRLNVLFTRAKQQVRLFTSMRPSDIRVDENSAICISEDFGSNWEEQ